MTSELLNKGIDAVKEIANISAKGVEDNKIDLKVARDIQKRLETLTDVLEEVFKDMVRVDNMREQIKNMNIKLDEHLNRFQ
jgi:hypothetical protein